eukprot:403350503
MSLYQNQRSSQQQQQQNITQKGNDDQHIEAQNNSYYKNNNKQILNQRQINNEAHNQYNSQKELKSLQKERIRRKQKSFQVLDQQNQQNSYLENGDQSRYNTNQTLIKEQDQQDQIPANNQDIVKQNRRCMNMSFKEKRENRLRKKSLSSNFKEAREDSVESHDKFMLGNQSLNKLQTFEKQWLLFKDNLEPCNNSSQIKYLMVKYRSKGLRKVQELAFITNSNVLSSRNIKDPSICIVPQSTLHDAQKNQNMTLIKQPLNKANYFSNSETTDKFRNTYSNTIDSVPITESTQRLNVIQPSDINQQRRLNDRAFQVRMSTQNHLNHNKNESKQNTSKQSQPLLKCSTKSLNQQAPQSLKITIKDCIKDQGIDKDQKENHIQTVQRSFMSNYKKMGDKNQTNNQSSSSLSTYDSRNYNTLNSLNQKVLSNSKHHNENVPDLSYNFQATQRIHIGNMKSLNYRQASKMKKISNKIAFNSNCLLYNQTVENYETQENQINEMEDFSQNPTENSSIQTSPRTFNVHINKDLKERKQSLNTAQTVKINLQREHPMPTSQYSVSQVNLFTNQNQQNGISTIQTLRVSQVNQNIITSNNSSRFSLNQQNQNSQSKAKYINNTLTSHNSRQQSISIKSTAKNR